MLREAKEKAACLLSSSSVVHEGPRNCKNFANFAANASLGSLIVQSVFGPERLFLLTGYTRDTAGRTTFRGLSHATVYLKCARPFMLTTVTFGAVYRSHIERPCIRELSVRGPSFEVVV